jgi:nucleotide-binding universal stress UspA family protein
MNFKRILIAINHSPLTSTVFERALHLAQQEQAHLMILTCITDVAELNQGIGSNGMMYGYGLYPIGGGFSQSAYTETIKSENQEAESWLQKYCQKATALNVPVEHQHHFTDPGTTICRVAEEWNADLIVLGRRDRAAIAEFFTGSVSNHVIHHTDCSVLIVKDDGTKPVGVPQQELEPPPVVPTQ